MGLLILFITACVLLTAIMVGGVVTQMRRPRRKTLGVALAMGGPGDPADLGLIAKPVMFNLSDHTKSSGWIVDGDMPHGSVAIVIHGHRDSRYGAIYRAQMLKPYVRATAIFDLPGHGDAEAKHCRMGYREADDVKAVARGLPPALVAGGVVLVGYSMGGVIALKAGASWGDDAGDATRVPAASRRPEAGLRSAAAWGQLPELRGVVAKSPYRFWDDGLRGQLRRRRLPQFVIVPGLWLLLKVFRGMADGPGFDRAEDAARLKVPLLVLHGDQDRICPLASGQAIAAAASDGEILVVKGGTHNQLLAADFDGVHAALARFFARVGHGAVADMMKRGGRPSPAYVSLESDP